MTHNPADIAPDLARLRELSEAATDGPWTSDEMDDGRIIVRNEGRGYPGAVLDGVRARRDAAFIVELVNAFRADPAALLGLVARDAADELAMKAEEYIEAVVSYLDPDNQFTHSRRRHLDRTGEELAELVAAILNQDAGSAEPEPGLRERLDRVEATVAVWEAWSPTLDPNVSPRVLALYVRDTIVRSLRAALGGSAEPGEGPVE